MLVLRVKAGSPARVGLRERDVIIGLDGPVADVKELVERLPSTWDSSSITLLVWRDQREVTLGRQETSKE